VWFKTGPGDYAEGDVFLGVAVPVMRKISLRYRELELDELQTLLETKEHEFRSAALEILVARHKRAEPDERRKILRFYLANTQYINNWDLVDISCGEIVGGELKAGRRELLDTLVQSQNLWERRIAMVATRALVREDELEDALRMAEILLEDAHDLIHKAVGWVLREIGDKNRRALLEFLEEHYARVPRTALRYAIEHFTPGERRRLLKGEFAGVADCAEDYNASRARSTLTGSGRTRKSA
jgi:3-methyladenine DNA glycosylase AlkD